MPKLLWVALPLLVAAALLAVAVLRGRGPSRASLNAWSSLLLLAYLVVTASLGIFWVANQQLPVFDWHYLFGYGTVLLVSLHLAINFPAVWRHFARRAPERTRRPASPQGARRTALGAAVAAAAATAGFFLGFRHRQAGPEGSTPVAAPSSTTAAPGLALVERFHALSGHTRSGLLLRAPGAEWEAEPAAFKTYPAAARIALPEPRGLPAQAPDLARLGALLWHTSGVTERRGGLALRASPSSGALFSTELYVQVNSWPGLVPGVWHYDPQRHHLERVGESGVQDEARVSVIATAVFARTGRKYRDRTYRYVLADLGHALENLRAAGAALGEVVHVAHAFDDERLAHALGIDQQEEGVLAVARLGAPGTPPQGAVSVRAGGPATFDAADARSVTASIHAATSARSSTSPPAQAGPSGNRTRIRLPSVRASAGDVLHAIATRRSVRRFVKDAPVSLDAVAAILHAMADPEPARLSGAVRIHLVANTVDGLLPGAYAYAPALHALDASRPPSDLRAAARAAALEQDVIGDAAAVFVLAIDRAGFASDPLGPARGYRHAFLQAGMMGERIYLGAQRHALGACAVGAFYDDEAAALVGVDAAKEWVVHFAALGVPAR